MVDTDRSLPDDAILSVVVAVIRAAWATRMGLRRTIALGGAMELTITGLAVVGPYLLKLLVDELTARSTRLLPVLVVAAAFILTWSAGAVLATWRLAYSTRVVDRVTQDLAERVLRNRLPAFAKSRQGDSGELLGLLERLSYALTIIVDGLVWRVVPLALQLIGSLLVVAEVIPMTYAVVLGVALVSYTLASWRAASVHRHAAARSNVAAAQLSADLGDVLRNARRVVFNGAVDTEIKSLRGRLQAKGGANQQMIGSLVIASLIQYGLLSLGLFFLLGMASRDALAGRLSVSDFVFMQAYAFRLVIPLSGFGFIVGQAVSSIGIVRQVLAFAKAGDGGARPPIPLEGPAEIRLDNVSFRYADKGAGLEDVSTVIAPGSFVAIVGPNGSGKSTLAQMMAGVLDPASGSVTVADRAMTDVAPEDRHQLVLYVPQLISLFNRSLAENALYPPTGQTEAGLIALLSEWRFYDTLRSVDLSKIAGESGERLSGGQLQKLELARVAGVDAPAVILDESTSALDPGSEVEIIETLRQRMAGRTTLIVVTHRMGVAEIADHVLFVKEGRLVRQGTHAKLVADSAAYGRFWKIMTQ